MALVAKRAYNAPGGPSLITGSFRALSSMDVFPSVDMDAMTPFRIEWNVGRGRLEAIPAGGPGLAANSVHNTIHGWTGKSVKYAVGPHAETIAVILEGEFGGYSTDTSNTPMKLWYLSAATAGRLDTAEAYVGAPAVAVRTEYDPDLGEKVYVKAKLLP